MKTAFVTLFALTVGAFALSGCEVSDCAEKDADGVCLQGKSLKRWVDSSPDLRTTTWASGGNVTVTGPNGDISVVQGVEGEVSASFTAFVMRAYDTPEDEIRANLESISKTANTDSTGNVTVVASRASGSPSTLGADIAVALPPSFDGVLTVNQNNGSTNMGFVGGALGVVLRSDNGSCQVNAGAAANIDLYCDNGGLTARVTDIATNFESGKFVTGNGSIELTFPAGGVFSIAARAMDGGVVDTTSAEAAGCLVQVASEASKTVSCNGATVADPEYSAQAQGTGLADVIIKVQ